TEEIEEGALLDTKIVYNQGQEEKQLTQILGAATGNKVHHIILNTAIPLIDFRLELEWGSATKPIKVRKIYISGIYMNKNGTI
ncbi:MAG: hypothetical protein PHR29_05610, partial [Acholeplasmataceae bacterium]|nr:hypothetical protein [Acholeplasmataceae bacterium]